MNSTKQNIKINFSKAEQENCGFRFRYRGLITAARYQLHQIKNFKRKECLQQGLSSQFHQIKNSKRNNITHLFFPKPKQFGFGIGVFISLRIFI